MRARLIFCTILALGALLTAGAGAGFAQSGLDDSSNAGEQQYGKPKARTDVLGEVGTVGEDDSGSAPTSQDSVPDAQATEAPQVAAAPDAEGGELPFTGFAVVTTLLLGLALVGAGLVLRRPARRGHER